MSSSLKRIRNIFYDSFSSSSSDSSSEDELEESIVIEVEKKKLEMRKRSILYNDSIKPRKFTNRKHIQGHQNLIDDYFSETPTYSETTFRRRFRIRRSLFLRIQSAVEAHESYFQQRRNAANKLGLSSLQKITVALRMIAYGVTGDFMDEYVKIGESTANKSLKLFAKTVISIFGDEYLRSLNNENITRLLAINKERGFPGMLGSIDCMHWKWKNCPSAWKGMYCGHVHEPTLILEAVASYDLWIWHAFFGMPGSHNDINVLEQSSVFSELAEGRAPAINYSINGHNYKMGYYLADGIYPSWATFVKTIPQPLGNKKKHFAQCQEAARKDVERTFGVLQARFAILRGPARFSHQNTIKDVIIACIILHNMIVEDERNLYPGEEDLHTYDQINEEPLPTIIEDKTELIDFIEHHHRIRDREVHSQLQNDLVEHLWNQYSMS